MVFQDPAQIELDDFLEGAEPDWEAPPEENLGEDRANQLLRRLARAEDELALDQRRARAQIAQVEAWLAERERIHAGRIGYLRDTLELYQEAVWERTGTATIRLPAGDLESSKRQPEWEVLDEGALLAWAAQHAPSMVRQKPPPPPEVDRNEMKRLLTRRDAKGRPTAFGVDENGEQPPGLQVVVPADSDRRWKQIPAGRPALPEESA